MNGEEKDKQATRVECEISADRRECNKGRDLLGSDRERYTSPVEIFERKKATTTRSGSLRKFG